MTFTTTPLADGSTLVEGTDSKGNEGTTILKSEKWAAYLHLLANEQANALFDEEVREFFAPLTEAADRAATLFNQLNGVDEDLAVLTIDEGSKTTEARVIVLDEDGILLRLLHEGLTDRLRWVNNVLVATR